MSGRVGDLSFKQQEKLLKFKANLVDILKPEHDEYCLLRFLRAREFDLQKCEFMFRQDIEWRKKARIESLVDEFEPPEVCEQYVAGGFLDGYDKDQGPIRIIPIGNFDPKGLLFSCRTRDIETHILVMIERMFRDNEIRCKKRSKKIDWGVTMIIDVEGLGLRHIWKPFMDVVTQILSIGELHYPETTKRIFIIKAPSIFPMAFSICKPFLKQHTREKIKVLGSNWKEILLQYIDADVLPVYWGGTKTDPDGDPKCPSMIKPGGEVPKSYYKEVDFEAREFVTKDISRGARHEVTFNVTHAGSLLRYQFKTYNHDIGFGIYEVDATARKTSVLEHSRYNSHMVPEDGELILDKPGNYVLVFDNSYSWTRGKKISYWLDTVEPEALELTDDDETDFLQAMIDKTNP